MKINDEELNNLISNTSIEPNAQWQSTALENIKKSVTNSNNIGSNNSNLNFISNIMMKRKIVIMGTVFLSLLSVVAVLGLAVITLRTNQNALNSNEILAKIALTNPGLSQSRSLSSSAAGANATSEMYATDSKLIAPGYYPINSDYNYYYSKSSTKRGPAFNACTYGIDQSSVVYVPTYESFNYSDGTSYYSKYVGYNEDDSINTLSISKSTTSDTLYEYEDTTYFGGSYAVRNINKTQIDSSLVKPMVRGSEEPVLLDDSSASDSVSSNVNESSIVADDAASYFGGNATVERTENIKGKDYYVVQYYYETNCAGFVNLDRWNSNTVEDNKTIYTVTYASVDNYQILKTETYINSVAPGNLMETTENINDNSNIDFASVASNFEFTVNVPIKEIDLSSQSTTVSTYDPDTEVQKSVDFAKSKNLTVVLPSVNATNQYIYLNYSTPADYISETNSYYSDRAFYPAGSIGDKMFNSYNGISTSIIYSSGVTSLGSVSYTVGDSSYSLNTYENTVDEKKILNSFLYADIRNKNESSVNITVDGESVAATLYTYEVEQPEISVLPYAAELRVDPAAPQNTCTEDCFAKQYLLVFTYNNSKYALQEYTYTSGAGDTEFNAETDGMFKALFAGNATELAELETLLSNSIKGTYVDGGTVNEVAPSKPML